MQHSSASTATNFEAFYFWQGFTLKIQHKDVAMLLWKNQTFRAEWKLGSFILRHSMAILGKRFSVKFISHWTPNMSSSYFHSILKWLLRFKHFDCVLTLECQTSFYKYTSGIPFENFVPKWKFKRTHQWNNTRIWNKPVTLAQIPHHKLWPQHVKHFISYLSSLDSEIRVKHTPKSPNVVKQTEIMVGRWWEGLPNLADYVQQLFTSSKLVIRLWLEYLL